jgi:competence protein ComEC
MEPIIPLTIWCTLFATLFIFHFSASRIYYARKIIGINIIVLLFITGFTNLSIHSPELNPKNVTNIYLPGDQLSLSIAELKYGQGDYYKSISRVNYLIRNKDTIRANGKILHYIHKDFGLIETGDQLKITSLLHPIENKGNPGEFNQEKFWFNQGVTRQIFSTPNEVELINKSFRLSGFWEKTRKYLIQELEQKLNPNVLGLVVALSLGDKTLLDKEVRENFANAGAMHVLAVSGLHVGILLGIIQYLCKFSSFLRKNYRYLYVSLTIIWLYALLTGLSPSVSRAAVMFTLLAIGRANGYSFFSIYSLLISAFVLLLINPFLIFHIGFQLSYFAMFGIAFFYNKINNFLAFENKWVRKLWNGTALGIAAQVGTAPLSLYYFHQFPNFFMVTNIIFILLAGIALGIVLLFLVFHFIPLISDMIAQGIDYLYLFILELVSLINEFPFHIASGFAIGLLSISLFYIILTALVYFREKQKYKPFVISLVGLMLVASSFIYSRYLNLNKEELVILNHKYHVVLLKYPGGIYCFYDYKAKNDEESVAFDVDLFHKKHGGTLNYEVLPSGPDQYKTITILDHKIKLKSNKNYTEFVINNEIIVLPKKSYLPDNVEEKAKIITGLFSPYYKGEPNHNLKKEGAFYYPI